MRVKSDPQPFSAPLRRPQCSAGLGGMTPNICTSLSEPPTVEIFLAAPVMKVPRPEWLERMTVR